MLREIVEKYKVNRVKIVPANEFIVYIKNNEKFHYKGGKTNFWKRSEMYSSGTGVEATWQKFVRQFSTTTNAAEIVDRLIDDGWEVTDVKIVN